MRYSGNKALIYIDDTQIIGTAVRPCGNSAMAKLAAVREEYSGIIDSEFADKENFSLTFARVVAELARQVGNTSMPDILYVAVPNEFCRVETKENSTTFRYPARIGRQHLKDLVAEIDFDTNGAEIISQNPLYYTVDGTDDAMLDVRGIKTEKLSVVCNTVSVPHEFQACIPVSNARFVSVAESELFMLPVTSRDAGCTIIRSDFFSTSVSHIIGDGITYLSHFDMGPGYIVNELAESFQLDYDTAMKLLWTATPTVQMGPEDNYTVSGRVIPGAIVNNIITKRIGEFGERLAGLDMARVVYITGGNLNDIYGVRNMLSNAIDRRIRPAADILTKRDKYPDATINAILRKICAGLSK
jgi:cell division ATPase FtsA